VNNNTLNRIIVSFILTALVFTTYNFALNGHYHRTAEGILLYHYHPYEHSEDNDPESGSHSHSELQFVNLEISGHSRFFVVIAIISLREFLLDRFEDLNQDLILPRLAVQMFSPLLRAPPFQI